MSPEHGPIPVRDRPIALLAALAGVIVGVVAAAAHHKPLPPPPVDVVVPVEAAPALPPAPPPPPVPAPIAPEVHTPLPLPSLTSSSRTTGAGFSIKSGVSSLPEATLDGHVREALAMCRDKIDATILEQDQVVRCATAFTESEALLAPLQAGQVAVWLLERSYQAPVVPPPSVPSSGAQCQGNLGKLVLPSQALGRSSSSGSSGEADEASCDWLVREPPSVAMGEAALAYFVPSHPTSDRVMPMDDDTTRFVSEQVVDGVFRRIDVVGTLTGSSVSLTYWSPFRAAGPHSVFSDDEALQLLRQEPMPACARMLVTNGPPPITDREQRRAWRELADACIARHVQQ